MDEVKELSCHLLRQNCYIVTKLCLRYTYVPDHELTVGLSKPNFGSIWPKGEKIHEDVGDGGHCVCRQVFSPIKKIQL